MEVITDYHTYMSRRRSWPIGRFLAATAARTPARYPVHQFRCGHVTAEGRKVTALRGEDITLTAAAEAYLSTARVANPNTQRAYAGAIDRTVTILGAGRLLAEVPDDDIGAALTQLWGKCAPATWNRNRAAISSCRLRREP